MTNNSLKILVAEDDLLNQKVATGYLKKLGFAPDIAEDGKKAVKATREKYYDLIFMDIQMPEMDGYEATREIRKFQEEEEENQTVIFAITAHVLDNTREECLQQGLDDYIAKPVTFNVFKKKIKKWFPDKVNVQV